MDPLQRVTTVQVPWEGGRSADLSPEADRTPGQETADKHCEEDGAGIQQSFPCGASTCRDLYHQDLHRQKASLHASLHASLMCSSRGGGLGLHGRLLVEGCGWHARRPHIWGPKADDVRVARSAEAALLQPRRQISTDGVVSVGGWPHYAPGLAETPSLRGVWPGPKRKSDLRALSYSGTSP